jgi:hypothetical protein
MHAIVAALVAAIWFELVYFAPHTLSEPLATALIVPAALLLTGGPSQKRLVIGGGLLALAFVWRFQYAPAMAVFALGACWRQWRNAIPLVVGGLAVLLLAAMVDYRTVLYREQLMQILKTLHDRHPSSGGAGGAYLASSYYLVGATMLLLCALWSGWRHALLIVAAVEHRIHGCSNWGIPVHIFVICLAHRPSGAWLSRLRPDDARGLRGVSGHAVVVGGGC